MLVARLAKEPGDQAQKARRLGISRQYLGFLLNGQRPITFELARRWRMRYPEIALAFVAALTDHDESDREQVAV